MKNYVQKSLDMEEDDRSFKHEPVSKYMTAELITFHPDTDIATVISILLENRISGAPVLSEQGELVGLIDDKDCLNVLIESAYYNQPGNKQTVSTYMSNVMRTIHKNANILDVATIFLRSPYKRLLVLDDDGRLVGQISRSDLLRVFEQMKTTTW